MCKHVTIALALVAVIGLATSAAHAQYTSADRTAASDHKIDESNNVIQRQIEHLGILDQLSRIEALLNEMSECVAGCRGPHVGELCAKPCFVDPQTEECVCPGDPTEPPQ